MDPVGQNLNNTVIDTLSDVSIVQKSLGGKSTGLEILQLHQTLGYTVPPFVVLPTDTFPLLIDGDSVTLPDIIVEIAQRFLSESSSTHMIARSDALQEDGELSFAGRYESVEFELDSYDRLKKAVVTVYESLHSAQAQAYCDEHGIVSDKMRVILQEYIEGDFYGVIYTSNPTRPHELTIEYSETKNAVARGLGDTVTIDIDKKTDQASYATDQYEYFNHSSGWLSKIITIANQLDKTVGFSDLEFVIREGEVYLVQCRPITDLTSSTQIEIPNYPRSAFIGRSDVCRGTGSQVLPVVKMDDLDVAISDPKIDMIARMFPDALEERISSFYESWLAQLERLNREFSDGYILLTPHFHESTFDGRAALGNDFSGTSFHELSSNKKALITTKFALIASHAMTICRESGIQYAGFKNRQDIFDGLKTGDMVGIYFVNGRAEVYRAGKVERTIDIRNLFEQTGLKLSRCENGTRGLSAKSPYSPISDFYEGFRQFFEQATGEKWKFRENESHFGGTYLNAEGRGITLDGFWMASVPNFRFSSIPSQDRKIRKKYPNAELIQLIEKLAQYCQS